jgi:hypothetical protein
MTTEEYTQKRKEIEQKCEEDKKLLMMQFVRENNPYKIGDIITDHEGSIKIEKMTYSWHGPAAVYYGTIVNKNGTMHKAGKQRGVYQLNIGK